MNFTCKLHALYWILKTFFCMNPLKWSSRKPVLYNYEAPKILVSALKLPAERLCGWEENVFHLKLLKMPDLGSMDCVMQIQVLS